MTDPLELYGLPLERFTEERNALAKELRRAGEREEAARVAKLRKPSVAAWAVNQLVRTQRREIDSLFKAGDGLQKAQASLLAGRSDPAALRQAVEAERAAADQLTERARGLLSSDGHELTPTRLEQVTETLHAAALDPEARAQVRDGCLERELRHVGLGGLSAAPSGRRTPRPAQAGQERSTQKGAARKAEAAARRRAELTAKRLKTAQTRRDKAAELLREADEALTAARREAEAAEREHRRAKTDARD